MAVLFTQHYFQAFDDNGDPLSGGKLYTWEAGTAQGTPKATYTTAAGSVENANPVVLDAAGRATIFLSGSYDFVLKTSAGVLVKETDNISAFATSVSGGVSDITTDYTDTVVATGDSFVFSDVSDSGATKRDTIQGIIDLIPGVSADIVTSSAVLDDYYLVAGNGGARDIRSLASLGTSGQILTSNGAGSLPTFETSAGASAAAQSDQETATSTTLFVSPGRQQYHPSAAKFWVRSPGSSTVTSSYNVTSITDNGVGSWTVNIATDFSNANWTPLVSVGEGEESADTDPIPHALIGGESGSGVSVPAAGTIRIRVRDALTGSGTTVESDRLFTVVGFGDQ